MASSMGQGGLMDFRSGNGMVDISGKDATKRKAIARGIICLGQAAYEKLHQSGSPKGDVLETARVAAIMAVKKTPDIIPLCHPLLIEKVHVNIDHLKDQHALAVSVEVISSGKTGVEMEALHAASAACLTIYDMMKWAGQGMQISAIELVHKSGGQSGDYDLNNKS